MFSNNLISAVLLPAEAFHQLSFRRPLKVSASSSKDRLRFTRSAPDAASPWNGSTSIFVTTVVRNWIGPFFLRLSLWKNAKKRRKKSGGGLKTASDIHRKQKVNSGFFPLFAADKLDDIVRRTIQNFTEPFHGIYRNSSIMFQIVDRSGIDMILSNKEICGDSLFFHCPP